MSKEKIIFNLVNLRKEVEKNQQNIKTPERYYTTIGLIIDCSNVYRYETSRDFTQKFKIIDFSNQAQPLQVIIFSSRKEDFTLNIKIGDVLLINNFKVDTYNNQLQAKKAFKVEDSYFRIFNGNPELQNYSPVDRKVGLDDEDGRILSSLNELRRFSKTYFKANKIPVVYTKEGKEKKGQKKIASSDFDLIFRVVESIDVFGLYKIILTNEKDEFHMNFTRPIEPGVYKVRSIAQAKWEEKFCSLAGNDYTTFIEIPSWMKSYDSKQWDKLVTEPGKKKVQRQKIETRITNAAKRKRITLKELIERDQHTDEVRVICEVSLITTKFDDVVKKYDAENANEKSYLSECGEYVFTVHLLISDDSLNGEVFNAYVYTFDGRGKEFLPNIGNETIFGRNMADLKENYEHFTNRLLEETDFEEKPIELVLSPMYNGRETIYRIVDTQLLF